MSYITEKTYSYEDMLSAFEEGILFNKNGDKTELNSVVIENEFESFMDEYVNKNE